MHGSHDLTVFQLNSNYSQACVREGGTRGRGGEVGRERERKRERGGWGQGGEVFTDFFPEWQG